MKKLISVILVAVMLLGLCACASSEESEKGSLPALKEGHLPGCN